MIAAVVFAFAFTPAHAGPGALEGAVSTERYLVENLSIRQGEQVMFANLDLINAHTITSWDLIDGVPLFNTGDVAPRTVKTMTDVSSLPPGPYGYYCAKHINMTGTLVVS